MIVRDDVVDVLATEEESVVLTSERCLRLTQLSTCVLVFVASPRTREELEEHLERNFGPAPPGALDGVLAEMEEARLIRRNRIGHLAEY